MMTRKIFVLQLVCVLGFVFQSAIAGPVFYYDIDPGVGPAGPGTNSDAEAAAFDGAAGSLGLITLIDFEGPAAKTLSGLTLAPGVTVTFSNTENGSEYNGVSTSDDVIKGYNTTSGGEKHFGMVPVLDTANPVTAAVTFNFDVPVQAFGAYFTGVQTAGGELHTLFNDGTAQDRVIAGDPAGGVLFFGFTSAESSITSVTLEIQGVPWSSRDFIGIDDMRFVSVPEPATLALLGLGGVLLRKRK